MTSGRILCRKEDLNTLSSHYHSDKKGQKKKNQNWKQKKWYATRPRPTLCYNEDLRFNCPPCKLPNLVKKNQNQNGSKRSEIPKLGNLKTEEIFFLWKKKQI